MNKKVTLADVARSLGLSKTVVLLVINGKGVYHEISKDTQRRVREKLMNSTTPPISWHAAFVLAARTPLA
jgi:cyanate lyase